MKPIASRNLYVLGNPTETMSIEIYTPKRVSRTPSSDWRVDYRIHGPGYEKMAAYFGVDSIQALQTLMLMVGFKLDYINEFRFDGKLRGWRMT